MARMESSQEWKGMGCEMGLELAACHAEGTGDPSEVSSREQGIRFVF